MFGKIKTDHSSRLQSVKIHKNPNCPKRKLSKMENPCTIVCVIMLLLSLSHVSAASTLLDKIREDSDLSEVSHAHCQFLLLFIVVSLRIAEINALRFKFK